MVYFAFVWCSARAWFGLLSWLLQHHSEPGSNQELHYSVCGRLFLQGSCVSKSLAIEIKKLHHMYFILIEQSRCRYVCKKEDNCHSIFHEKGELNDSDRSFEWKLNELLQIVLQFGSTTLFHNFPHHCFTKTNLNKERKENFLCDH